MTVHDDESAGIVEDILSRLVARLRTRDADGIMERFSDGAALFGSAAGEHAAGAPGLRTFFTTITAPATYRWTWPPPLVARRGDVLWFVAPATAELRSDDGTGQTLPYRLSGVLRKSTGGWLFELFNGS